MFWGQFPLNLISVLMLFSCRDLREPLISFLLLFLSFLRWRWVINSWKKSNQLSNHGSKEEPHAWKQITIKSCQCTGLQELDADWWADWPKSGTHCSHLAQRGEKASPAAACLPSQHSWMLSGLIRSASPLCQWASGPDNVITPDGDVLLLKQCDGSSRDKSLNRVH